MGVVPCHTPSPGGAEDDHEHGMTNIITYLGSRYGVELHIARFSDFGHVQVAAEVEERI